MAQIINNQSSGDYRSQKSNFWGGSIFFSFFTRNDPLLGEKNGGGASVRTSLGERLYASVLQRQVGRAETPGERNVIKE